MFIVGSTNQIKVQAAQEVLKDYPHLCPKEVISASVPSEISEQPMTLEEIILGAKNRAKNAWRPDCRLTFGIESGLFPASGTQTGYLEACICCVYDGKNFFIGLSCGFEVPSKILSLVLHEKMDLSQAVYASGFSNNPKLGSAEGLIGILSKGRITRKEYTKQAVAMALAQFDHAEFY